MKKLIVLILFALLIAGCSAEWYAHDTLYKTNSHMFYSWWGYRNTTADDAKQSTEQGWWGKEIPYIPAE
jgi:hypothetical protein